MRMRSSGATTKSVTMRAIGDGVFAGSCYETIAARSSGTQSMVPALHAADDADDGDVVVAAGESVALVADTPNTVVADVDAGHRCTWVLHNCYCTFAAADKTADDWWYLNSGVAPDETAGSCFRTSRTQNTAPALPAGDEGDAIVPAAAVVVVVVAAAGTVVASDSCCRSADSLLRH